MEINSSLTSTLNFETSIIKAFEKYKEKNFTFDDEKILDVQKIFLEIIKKNKSFEVNGIKLNLNDNEWDFSKLRISGKHKRLVFRFDNRMHHTLVSQEFHLILKLYALSKALGNCIYKTGNFDKFNISRNFLFYCEENNIFSFRFLTCDVLEKYLNRNDISYTTILNYKTILYDFINFFGKITNQEIDFDIKEFLSKRDINKVKAIVESNKTPLIPNNFLNLYKTILYKEFFSTNDLKHKGLIGLLYLDTQTGLRSNELLMLTCDSVEEIKKNGFTLYCLNYKSTKGARGNQIYAINKTALNESSVNVINELIVSYKKLRNKCKTKLLVPNPNSKHSFEYTCTNLLMENFRMCCKYSVELNLKNIPKNGVFLGYYVRNSNAKKYHLGVNKDEFRRYGIKNGDSISYPILKQFRVFYATYLHDKGVSDILISKMLGHTTVNLVSYYVRPKHKIQEDIDFTKELLEEIITDDLEILGDKGKYYKNKINDIIQENSFNIKKDLNAIIDAVCNQMPIRMKSCGFCMKSAVGRSCDFDSQTNEFYCAYNCCLNHCHLYFDVPKIYKKCKDQIKIIFYNDKNGFINAAQKSCYQLESFITREFIPELRELEKEINIKGIEKIEGRHAELKKFIENMPNVKKEIEEWKIIINSHLKKI